MPTHTASTTLPDADGCSPHWQILSDLTLAVSKASSGRIGEILPWIDEIVAAFDVVLEHNERYPPALHNAILCGLATLNSYYAKSDDCDYFRCAVRESRSLL